MREIEALPESEQEEFARELLKMAMRKEIDAELAASEAEGGEILHEEVFRRLQEKLVRGLPKIAVRKRIDAKLATAKARGGETPHETFVAELKQRYGG